MHPDICEGRAGFPKPGNHSSDTIGITQTPNALKPVTREDFGPLNSIPISVVRTHAYEHHWAIVVNSLHALLRFHSQTKKSIANNGNALGSGTSRLFTGAGRLSIPPTHATSRTPIGPTSNVVTLHSGNQSGGGQVGIDPR